MSLGASQFRPLSKMFHGLMFLSHSIEETYVIRAVKSAFVFAPIICPSFKIKPLRKVG